MHLSRRLVAIVAAGLLAAAAGSGAAAPPQSARFLYEEAFAREHVLRGDLDAPEPGLVPRPTVQQVRAVIAAYEEVVRRYPTSRYCDNALWQAAGLAAEAARRWDQDRDRRTAARLLRLLIEEYPGSPLVRTARGQLAATQAALSPASPVPPRIAPPAPRSAAAPATPSAAKTETPPAPIATVRGVRRTVLTDVVRVTIELDQEVAYKTEQLDNPARVLFDFAPTRMAAGLVEGTLRSTDDAGPRIRVGRHPE
ncbi:MAG: hypothetical protein IMZ44_18695, partial [Planctomycetes bacterium]|nr:hypothetical protein [Planctomycetota bacterium]